MMSLPLVLLTLGLLSGSPMVGDLAPAAPQMTSMEVLSTPMDVDGHGFSLFQPIGKGLPIFVPTTNLAVCDDELPLFCPPGCLCLIIRDVKQCFC